MNLTDAHLDHTSNAEGAGCLIVPSTENASEHEPAGANIEVQDSFDGVSESNLSTDLSTPVVDSGVEEQPTHIEMSTHIPLADYVFESNCADNNGGEQEPETSLHASSTKKYRK
ncbi:hypothetical protein V6N13_005283 [Hibiscus sabdariffa]